MSAREIEQTALQAPRSHAQFPLFDSLRALAALSILVVHVAVLSGVFANETYFRFVGHLDIGVPFFFLLSAFLLYRPFVAARVEGREYGSLRTYARRRFVRIMPAYWAALTIAAIVPGMAGAFSGDWWVYYGLLQNFPIYTEDGTCAINAYRCGIPPSWSLAIEVLFYAVLPLFALGMDWVARRWRGRNRLTPELIVIGAIALISVWIQSDVPRSDAQQWLFYSPLGRGWWFGLGLGLAAISVHAGAGGFASLRSRLAGRGWAGAAALSAVVAYLLASAFVLEPGPGLAYPIGDQLNYVFGYLITGVIAALVVLPAIFDRDGGGLYRRILAHPVLTWLGLISYGIFLWQFPVIVALADLGLIDGIGVGDFWLLLAPTLVGTVICAALSYYLLELPLMRRFRSRPLTGGPAAPPGTAQPGRVPP